MKLPKTPCSADGISVRALISSVDNTFDDWFFVGGILAGTIGHPVAWLRDYKNRVSVTPFDCVAVTDAFFLETVCENYRNDFRVLPGTPDGLLGEVLFECKFGKEKFVSKLEQEYSSVVTIRRAWKTRIKGKEVCEQFSLDVDSKPFQKKQE
jgi:hypothetical protein